jgi:hypothetical protein
MDARENQRQTLMCGPLKNVLTYTSDCCCSCPSIKLASDCSLSDYSQGGAGCARAAAAARARAQPTCVERSTTLRAPRVQAFFIGRGEGEGEGGGGQGQTGRVEGEEE